MRTVSCPCGLGWKTSHGFTFAEVVVAIAIAGMTFAGVLYGYVMTVNQGEWSCYRRGKQRGPFTNTVITLRTCIAILATFLGSIITT